ncbi:inositol monophosphatase family protein [Oceanibacterium hippocampi]|uniref:Inositol-1-monophosphatase n=1 Tax=Oceanibacterium hippocampi TaxID=745714 RepID=A0A1Y5T6A2_9PROT|nr:inositol monophosphatase [Oceanibacterium hippocampi]SLN54730.1 Inositol-1-monophosphatase [Oceanibacterium hippocampi]
MSIDHDAVARVIREIAGTVIMPRFRRLASHEVSEKTPGDPVTVADLEAETMLTDRLLRLKPGSIVIGEEGVHADPALLESLESEPAVWLVDPIDGTLNFAAGLPLFCVMVAYLEHGVTRAAWIHDPVRDITAIAVDGQGTKLDGETIRLDAHGDLGRYAGCLHLRGDAGLMRAAAGNWSHMGPLLVLHCAGQEYLAMLSGRLNFAFYHNANPWDQLPGLLIHREAGGHAGQLDGSAYGLRAETRTAPLLVAPSLSCWQDIRRTLFELD